MVDHFFLNTLCLGNEVNFRPTNQNLYYIKKDLKEQYYEKDTYILPDGEKLKISPELGYDRDALAYLYFNSDLVKDYIHMKADNLLYMSNFTNLFETPNDRKRNY